MKELEKNLEATGGVPAEAELAAINRFAKSPLRAEEVYTFSLRLCDNEVDRDWERWEFYAQQNGLAHTGRPVYRPDRPGGAVRGEERHL